MTLREHRVSAGLSQRKVAVTLGVSPGCYANWELGGRHIPAHICSRLQEYFGWAVGEYQDRDVVEATPNLPTPGKQPRRVRGSENLERQLERKQYLAALLLLCIVDVATARRLLDRSLTEWPVVLRARRVAA